MKKSKILIIITILIAIWSIALTGYFKYLYKYNQIAKLENKSNQEIYLLGTYHDMHFDRLLNYSMKDVLNCIKNIRPDVVLIESRNKIYQKYNVVDGPIDMMMAYSYCKQEGIPFYFIDWWELNDNFEPDTTNQERDDHIHQNILNQLEKIGNNKKVLILCGDIHFHEQISRFKNNKEYQLTVPYKENVFNSKDTFQYPLIMQETIENKIKYLSTTFQESIQQNVYNHNCKKEWINATDEMIANLKDELKLIQRNKLYHE